MPALRWYQRQAVDAVYREIRTHGRNALLSLPTGSGKSWIVAQLCVATFNRDEGGDDLAFAAELEVSNDTTELIVAGLSFPGDAYTVAPDALIVRYELAPSEACRRCPSEDEVPCSGLEAVEDPELSGRVAVSADPAPPEEGDVLYIFSAVQRDQRVVVGPQSEPYAWFDLPPGSADWTIFLKTTRDLECPDAGVESFCSVDVFLPHVDHGPFLRGDIDGNGVVQLTDSVGIFAFLFLGGAEPLCMAAAEVNGDRAVDISDGVYILSFLFLGGPPPLPPRECGFSSSPDDGDLGCRVTACD